MLLEVLRLRQMRNLEHIEVEPHPRFNILAGDNGQGKTNFLEAIYLLSAVRSFRARKNAELIQFGESKATLEGVVRLEITDGGKDVYLNNSPVRQLSDFFGTVNVVMFGPRDLSILKGSPSKRRDFVDSAIFNAHPAYATEQEHYDEVLRQRNALLKDENPDESLLAVYDEQLVQYGADLVGRRTDFVDNFRPVLARVFHEIFDAEIDADVRYDMKWAEKIDAPRRPPDRRVEVERVLADALDQTSRKERERGYTVIGPHRDDLQATLDGRPIATFGSQGQHRAFILAMKIAVITYRERNALLFDFLREKTEGQVFITTTHRDYIHLDEDVKTFEVDEGEITDG